MATKEELEEKLIVGTKIQIGKKYSEQYGFKEGEIIELMEGYFERDNGLFTVEETAPSVWCKKQKDFDSIYHLFGNDLENFLDCKILNIEY